MNDQPRENQDGEQSPESVSVQAGVNGTPPGPEQAGASGESASAQATAVEIPGEAPEEHSWRPADYYAAPRRAAMFPRWVPLTCGVAAVLALGAMVVVGAFLKSGGLAKLVAISFGQLNAEAARMFDDDVEASSREAFSRSLLAVRDGIADGRIELAGALPVLQQMQSATRDGKLSAAEVDDLTAMFEKSLAAPPPAPPPSEPPVVDL